VAARNNVLSIALSLIQASCEERIFEIHPGWIEEHLLQFQPTEGHKYFMKQLKVLQPVWVEAFEKSGLKVGLSTALAWITDHTCHYLNVESWMRRLKNNADREESKN
jgi:hypothetical protein